LIESRRKRGISLRRIEIVELAEIFDVRAALEGLAARLAAPLASVSDLSELAGYADAYDRGMKDEDIDAVDDADLSFHSTIIRLSESGYLLRLTEDCLPLQRAFLIQKSLIRFMQGRQLSGGIQAAPGASHADILDALRKREPERAERMLRSHVEGGKMAILERVTGIRRVYEA
jgi:DNA-binding GntR family transcriptional regulator